MFKSFSLIILNRIFFKNVVIKAVIKVIQSIIQIVIFLKAPRFLVYIGKEGQYVYSKVRINCVITFQPIIC